MVVHSFNKPLRKQRHMISLSSRPVWSAQFQDSLGYTVKVSKQTSTPMLWSIK